MLWHVVSSVASVPDGHLLLPFLIATLPPDGLDATLDLPIMFFKRSVLPSSFIKVLKYLLFH